ncbi:tetratricopeptide repeat protein [Flammeovirga kamogawensis]|uniref:peptidylprolyl isomerase n=1 Tax=Flammeovirga kamogawensis TaxID=373891 RepID=A0ABX8GT70_9BACT|nr:hypothetical protein [Flammeovirga kamogawensis]MBB6462473.1 tetratricopeptide (TPR) repeat protein [Flammeovirga kamogawensis]QWG06789.1 hypothetical protein KM029_15985 [Flammeovirga kamogawensis]TRX68612.1 hypothetical protein EO216_10980 [Flammeovirga kamogawensis]
MTRILFYVLSFTSILSFSTLENLYAQEDKSLDHYVQADELYKQKKFREAIDEYSLAISYDSLQENFYLKKARCQVILNEFNNAIDTFVEGTRHFPENGFMNYQLARLYLRKDYFKESIFYYDQSFKYLSNPSQRITAKNQIIMMLFKKEEYSKIRPHIEDVLSVADNNYIALYYSAKLHNMDKEYNDAVVDIKKALNYVPSDKHSQTARFYYELGYAYYNLEEYEKLANVLSKANYGPYKKLVAKLTPEYKYWIALCYFQIYDFDKSTNLLFNALKQDQSNLKLHELQIKIAEVTSDKSEQIRKAYMMIENLEDKQMKAKVYEDVANWQLSSEKFQEAVVSCDSALELDPYNYLVKYTKAVALFKQDKTDESIVVLEDLVKYNGLDVKTKSKYYFTLGIAAMKENELDIAINSFKSAKLDKTFKVAADDILNYLTSKGDSM